MESKRDTKNQTRKPKASKLKKLSKSKMLLIILSLIALSSAGFFYKKYQEAVKNPQAQIEQKNSQETKDIISSLGKIILLPTDKQPTVAKVEDIDKLKNSNQNFYKDVAKEDYLILYPDRAIIYRKKENKIINIAPIVDTSQNQNQTQTQTQSNP